MRPRHALTLLALALPLPVVLAGMPSSSPSVTAGPLQVPDRVLREEHSPVAAPAPSRAATRRTASRSRRPVTARRHVSRPAPTAVHTHRTTSRTVVRRSSTGYPWASDTSGGQDPWGFSKRQCVSYVAWRLAQVGRPVSTRQGYGSASGWDDVARRRGVTVTTRPAVGSVAQWNAGERSTAYLSGAPRGSFVAGSFGHVAWVTKVYADGSVQVSQYNGDGSRRWSTMRVRAPRFLRL